MNKGVSAVFTPDGLGTKAREKNALGSSQRLSMALLLASVLWAADRLQLWVWACVLSYVALSAVSLWRVTTGRSFARYSMNLYWAGALLTIAVARGTDGGELLLVMVLYPLSMAGVLHGLRRSLTLAACCSVLWLLDLTALGLAPTSPWPVLGIMMVPLVTSFASYPLAALRQRMNLAVELEQQLDPRRGLVAMGLKVGERLRAATQARRVLICHRDAEVPTVMVCDAEDGAFVASEALGGRVLALLADLETVAQVMPAGADSGAGDLGQRLQAPQSGPQGPLDRQKMSDLPLLLEADLLQAVPDRPGATGTNWMLVCYAHDEGKRRRPWPLEPLAGFAAEMRRLPQQASYIDRLQAEIAVNERSRIGRDMHDSSIQPYLGLKFAVEGQALRSDPNHALHGPIRELRAVCEAELVELRKIVSALRAGDTSGEFSLAPALQRQCKRFERLFDIEVNLQVRPDMPASRNLISALLHMVNEALNNVRRHTQARMVWVALSEVPGALQRRLHNGLDTEICITLPT